MIRNKKLDEKYFVTIQQSEFAATTVPKGIIHFGCGQPSPFLLAENYFRQASSLAFSQFGPRFLIFKLYVH